MQNCIMQKCIINDMCDYICKKAMFGPLLAGKDRPPPYGKGKKAGPGLGIGYPPRNFPRFRPVSPNLVVAGRSPPGPIPYYGFWSVLAARSVFFLRAGVFEA